MFNYKLGVVLDSLNVQQYLTEVPVLFVPSNVKLLMRTAFLQTVVTRMLNTGRTVQAMMFRSALHCLTVFIMKETTGSGVHCLPFPHFMFANDTRAAA